MSQASGWCLVIELDDDLQQFFPRYLMLYRDNVEDHYMMCPLDDMTSDKIGTRLRNIFLKNPGAYRDGLLLTFFYSPKGSPRAVYQEEEGRRGENVGQLVMGSKFLQGYKIKPHVPTLNADEISQVVYLVDAAVRALRAALDQPSEGKCSVRNAEGIMNCPFFQSGADPKRHHAAPSSTDNFLSVHRKPDSVHWSNVVSSLISSAVKSSSSQQQQSGSYREASSESSANNPKDLYRPRSLEAFCYPRVGVLIDVDEGNMGLKKPKKLLYYQNLATKAWDAEFVELQKGCENLCEVVYQLYNIIRTVDWESQSYPSTLDLYHIDFNSYHPKKLPLEVRDDLIEHFNHMSSPMPKIALELRPEPDNINEAFDGVIRLTGALKSAFQRHPGRSLGALLAEAKEGMQEDGNMENHRIDAHYRIAVIIHLPLSKWFPESNIESKPILYYHSLSTGATDVRNLDQPLADSIVRELRNILSETDTMGMLKPGILDVYEVYDNRDEANRCEKILQNVVLKFNRSPKPFSRLTPANRPMTEPKEVISRAKGVLNHFDEMHKKQKRKSWDHLMKVAEQFWKQPAHVKPVH